MQNFVVTYRKEFMRFPTSHVPALQRLLVVLLMLFVAPGAAGASPARHHVTASPVFIDAHGKCPVKPIATSADVCRTTRAGNAVAGTFPTRHHSWGVAFVYDCSGTQRGFWVFVGLPAMDGQLPDTGVYRGGERGSGYHMMTPAAIRDLHSVPSYWSGLENIEIRSTCAWRLRAIAGNAAVVRRYIPPSVKRK